MSRDLLVVVPSRGRPANMARLVQVVEHAQRAVLLVCQDDDDERYELPPGIIHVTGPRKSYAQWLNAIYDGGTMDEFAYVGAFGDDHLPQTPGWDEAICSTLEGLGTGYCWANDLHMEDRLSTNIFMTTDIPQALGRFAFRDFWQYCDLSWFTLGHAAGCMTYLPDVIIEHLHPAAGKAENDGVYTGSFKHYHEDMAVCAQYVAHQLQQDATIVRALRFARELPEPATVSA